MRGCCSRGCQGCAEIPLAIHGEQQARTYARAWQWHWRSVPLAVIKQVFTSCSVWVRKCFVMAALPGRAAVSIPGANQRRFCGHADASAGYVQRVRKRYLAVALGRPPADAWTEEGPIGSHPSFKCGA